MSKTKALLGEAKTTVNETVGAMAQKNANLLTGFMVVAVLVVGLSLINGRETWWISGVTVAVLFILFFLFLNARVLIKATLAFITATLTANFALQGGLVVEPRSTVGLVWLTAQMFLFFTLVALSYLVMGQRSRWTATMLGLVGALLSAALMAEVISLAVAIGISMVIGVAVFFGYYRGIGRITENRKLMPEPVSSEKIEEAIYAHCEAEGWHARRLATKRRGQEEVDYLVWNDAHAYLLHPVELNSKFGISPGRKATKLAHRGVSINTWLLNMANRRLPLWRARNAPIMLVLLDTTSKNGLKPQTIGVAMPDTVKKMPVGVYPAKGMLASAPKKSRGALSDIDSNFGDFTSALTDKHLKAMDEIGLTNESEYITPELVEESN